MRFVNDDLYRTEEMGGFIDDVKEGVKNIFKGKTITVQTEGGGTAKIGEGELSFTQGQQVGDLVQVPATGGFTDLLSNPYVVGAMVGVPLLILVLSFGKKGKRRR